MTVSGDDPLHGLMAQAAADLARRLDVALDAIEVVSAQAVVWPDRSLGCPRPGMNYQQVQVDGTRIVLAVASRRYAYHSGGTHGPFLCDRRMKSTDAPA